MTYGIWSTVFCVCVVCGGGGGGGGCEGEGKAGGVLMKRESRKREVIRLFIFILLLQFYNRLV